MKLLVFILNKEEVLADVMAAFLEAGVPGATILDSVGMGRFLTHEVPLFAGFRDLIQGGAPRNKTILAVIDDESVLPRLEKLLNRVCGGLSSPGTGIFFTVPVDYCAGLQPCAPEE
jgi:nitrogen regulatory protein PII